MKQHLLARCVILWHTCFFRHFLVQAGSPQPHPSGVVRASSPLQFSSPQAHKFTVPTKLPQMDFEIDPSYAGLIDISKSPHEQAKMFFWFIPTQSSIGANDLTLWSNGGPGCSSMIGAFQENGPIMWDPGRIKGVKNPLQEHSLPSFGSSWHTRSSMLYVDHPVGVGYSVGNVVIENEIQVADYLCRFLLAWLKVFPEMAGKNFYLAGESYAGMYLSYTAAAIHANKHQLPLSLQGLLLIDAVFSDSLLQEQVPLYTFVEKHKNTFKFDERLMAKLNETDKRCGYSEYLHKVSQSTPDQHLVYPSRGLLPELTLVCLESTATSTQNPKQVKPQCNIVTMVGGYQPKDEPPSFARIPDLVSDTSTIQKEKKETLSFKLTSIFRSPPDYVPSNIMWKKNFDYALDTFLTYFDMIDVKDAFNISGERKWHACMPSSDKSVRGCFLMCDGSGQLSLFPNGDQSSPPALTVLPEVIKKNKRTILAQGSLDAILFMDGTKLALQNLTWDGATGFQSPIEQRFSLGGKPAGRYNTERGLTYVEVDDSGHKLPHDKPDAALQIFAFLLGQLGSLSSPE
ncbi:hypothetical protein VP01_1652g4 [Puccinia sorghi]|uniref:Carboxypeptidase n=1 Tax=Puccinia sorghi TaxID=27349 RepID=A0A0L6VGK7_9BASI|nr:hypothetical protein VP01_1652g4 [Puccinia sorghi]